MILHHVFRRSEDLEHDADGRFTVRATLVMEVWWCDVTGWVIVDVLSSVEFVDENDPRAAKEWASCLGTNQRAVRVGLAGGQAFAARARSVVNRLAIDSEDLWTEQFQLWIEAVKLNEHVRALVKRGASLDEGS